ncbi:hypothetical protein ACFZDJ_11710 [Streptomyces sp. NPDC007896]|uniref:hypothetical protein n=1 Tax=Streptomyces sp. NPDC007896 TaxID=3364784 RepID=UPI0036EAC9D3
MWRPDQAERRPAAQLPGWAWLVDGRRGIEPGEVTVLAWLAAVALFCAPRVTVG